MRLTDWCVVSPRQHPATPDVDNCPQRGPEISAENKLSRRSGEFSRKCFIKPFYTNYVIHIRGYTHSRRHHYSSRLRCSNKKSYVKYFDNNLSRPLSAESVFGCNLWSPQAPADAVTCTLFALQLRKRLFTVFDCHNSLWTNTTTSKKSQRGFIVARVRHSSL